MFSRDRYLQVGVERITGSYFAIQIAFVGDRMGAYACVLVPPMTGCLCWRQSARPWIQSVRSFLQLDCCVNIEREFFV